MFFTLFVIIHKGMCLMNKYKYCVVVSVPLRVDDNVSHPIPSGLVVTNKLYPLESVCPME